MARPFDTRIAMLVKRGLTGVLQPLGFRKQGAHYRRRVNGLWWVIDVQRSQWNTHEKASFAINFGIFVPGVMALFGNSSDPPEPVVPASCIQGRAGMGGRDQWWDLRAEDTIPAADDEIAAGMERSLREYVLPFLERFRSEGDVIDYLEAARGQKGLLWPPSDPIRLAYLAILYHLSGDPERCRAALTEAQAAAARSPASFRAELSALAQRLRGT